MQEEQTPFLRLLERHGITKVTMVILCLLTAGFFAAFVLGAFIDGIKNQCLAATPFFSCDGASDFLSSVFTTGVSVFGPLLTFRWLIEKSMIFVFITLVLTLFATALGGAVLKYQYEKPV